MSPPRQPVTGRSNLATSRPEKGASLSSARSAGRVPRRTSMREPGGASIVRRPSHRTTAVPRASARISTSSTDSRPTTIGRVNKACAATGTTSSASSPGQTIGPPAEKA